MGDYFALQHRVFDTLDVLIGVSNSALFSAAAVPGAPLKSRVLRLNFATDRMQQDVDDDDADPARDGWLYAPLDLPNEDLSIVFLLCESCLTRR